MADVTSGEPLAGHRLPEQADAQEQAEFQRGLAVIAALLAAQRHQAHASLQCHALAEDA